MGEDKHTDTGFADTQSAELVEIELPGEEDLAALRELCTSMDKAAGDARAREAIARGLLKDLASSFDPATRAQPPDRHNSISAKIVQDFSALLTCFDQAAEILGYKPPAPNQRRYAGPEVRLRYCQVDQCDLSMRPIRWPLHLCGCRFRGPGMFMGATFAARAGFEHSTFEGGADFGLAKFQADASFSGVSFSASSSVAATFAGVTFCRQADFDLTRFASAVQFDYGTFEGQCRFFRSRFEGPATFLDVKFLAVSQFEFASFAAGADFAGVTFERAPDFHESSFGGKVNFSTSNFQEYLDLRTATFDPAASLNLADLRIRASTVLGGNVRLRSVQLQKWRWWPPGVDSLIEADRAGKIKSGARARREAALAEGGQQAGQRAQREYRRTLGATAQSLTSACAQYGVLEENFRAQGDPDSRGAEDFCHYRYHDLWRQTHFRWYNPLYWTNWFFLKLCIGYGVYPLRVLIAGLLLIVLFAALYGTAGLGMGGSGWDVETEMAAEPAAAAGQGPGGSTAGEQTTRRVCLSDLRGWQKWSKALYFSTMTWTTVGYGDWRPAGGMAQVAAAVEAILGVFITAVFTVCFARKLLR